MLIRNQEQQEEMKIVRHISCTLCHRQLDYPRIVINDTAVSSYHVSCALQLVGVITTDVVELVDDPHASDLVKRIEITNLLISLPRGQQRPEEK